MRILKTLIPQSVRLRYKLIKRYLLDKKTNIVFADNKKENIDCDKSISTTQPIKQSAFFENKVKNIQLGAKKIEQYTVSQGETFSFWEIIGNPSPKNGFKIGRNLINGQLKSDYGGGLCQLSGLIYMCSLKAGMTIVERHNHTVDIYTEEERFTPLGSDATIVYGYKDLRFVNPYPFPICFRFEIKDSEITCKLMINTQIEEQKIEFKRISSSNNNKTVSVKTFANDIHVTDSTYLLK